jgi:modification methylase
MVTLYNGDCMEVMLNQIEDDSIDTIVTSPPYNKSFFNKTTYNNQIWKGFEIKYASYSDDMPIEDYEKWMIEFLHLCVKKLKPGGSLFFNHKPIRHKNQIYHPIKFILESGVNVYQEIIWDRNISPNLRNDILSPCTERIWWITKGKPRVYKSAVGDAFRTEVWNISPRGGIDHPAPYPVELPTNCILLTTQPGDVILDPFLGSGTTGEASLALNRNFIGIELDEGYFKKCQEKLSKSKEYLW